jgi:hypothetical protein
MRLAELAISSGGSSPFVDSFVDEFVALLATADFGDSDGILNNAAPVNPTDGTPLLKRSLSNDGEEEMMLFAMGGCERIGGAGGQYCMFSCRCQRVVHMIVKIIVISIYFSSFNDVDLLRSMSADCCMPRRWEWGTMAAVGACVCMSSSFS